MGSSVAESWGRIVGWLEEHLPEAVETLQPPASAQDISRLRETMARRLPSDLIAWLLLNNGFNRRAAFGNLIPVLYVPMSTDQMLRDREMLQQVWTSIVPERPYAAEQAPAGTRSFEWLDAFLPIGDAGTDCHLFVDLREGDHFGCVGNYDAQAGGFDEPKWFSITEMLADVADALILDQPALADHGRRVHAANPFPTSPPRAWTPYIEDRYLRWNLVDL
ncbi:SMI1/KNR4 family protein [Kribbella sp. NPDC004875]|uniref:SMI1/KNR4 family protein n=1 Tax=Kribbella sp. NPDC004875 TaxID=3364107 RepID=UPI0036899DE2